MKVYVLLGFEGEEGFWFLLKTRVEKSGNTNGWEGRNWAWMVEPTTPVGLVEGRGYGLKDRRVCCRGPAENGNMQKGGAVGPGMDSI
jgi:hypothetical protein